MKKEKIHIDEFIKSGLKDFEESAPVGSWDEIAGNIASKKRKLVPVIWRWAAAVIILLGLGLLLNSYLNTLNQSYISTNESIFAPDIKSETEFPESAKQKTEIIDTDSDKIRKNNNLIPNQKQKSDNQPIKKSSIFDQKTKTEPPNEIYKSSTEEITLADKTSETPGEPAGDENITDKTSLDDPNKIIANNPDIDNNQKSVVIQSNNKADNYYEEKNVAEPEDSGETQKIESKNKKQNNWSVGGGVSPVYTFRTLNHTGNENQYNWTSGQNNEKNENPVVAFSGGVDVEYNHNRWSFSSGLYYSQTGTETDNFNFNRLIIFNSESNIYASTTAGNISYEQASPGVLETFNINDTDGPYIPDAFESDPIESDAKLKQDFEYIEIPFITKYKIIDKKIDIQVLAGISTSFLIGNTNKLMYSDNTLDMGEISNLRSVNYNSLVGLGFQVPFTRRMNFRLQPLFKYALKPINEDYTVENFPYSFAVYSGVSIDF